MLYYIFVYILQLQSTDGMSEGWDGNCALLCWQRDSLWAGFKLLYSLQDAGHTVGQVSLKEHLLFMVLTTRGRNKEAPNLWALWLCVRAWEQNRSLPTGGSPSRLSNKLCTSHTQRYKEMHRHIINYLWARCKSVTVTHKITDQRLRDKQSFFFFMVAITDVYVKLWVERVCCQLCAVGLEAFAWPSPAVCDQITVFLFIPRFLPLFSHSLTLSLQFPSSHSLSLLFPCIHRSVLMILLSKWRGRERKPPCLHTLISYTEEHYITNPLRKTCHLMALHVFLTNKARMEPPDSSIKYSI